MLEYYLAVPNCFAFLKIITFLEFKFMKKLRNKKIEMFHYFNKLWK